MKTCQDLNNLVFNRIARPRKNPSPIVYHSVVEWYIDNETLLENLEDYIRDNMFVHCIDDETIPMIANKIDKNR